MLKRNTLPDLSVLSSRLHPLNDNNELFLVGFLDFKPGESFTFEEVEKKLKELAELQHCETLCSMKKLARKFVGYYPHLCPEKWCAAEVKQGTILYCKDGSFRSLKLGKGRAVLEKGTQVFICIKGNPERESTIE